MLFYANKDLMLYLCFIGPSIKADFPLSVT